MIKWIKRLTGLDRLNQLEKENAHLKNKLVEKQEHINQTNAFWKKKIRNLKQSFEKKKEL